MNHRLDTDERVLFYENEFYPLSSFSAFRVTIDGIDYDTAEHAYHAQKFSSWEDKDRIQDAPSAHEAFRLARELASRVRPDWETVKVDVMRRIIQAKCEQHEYVRRKLVETGTRVLVEDSWRDDFWGIGPAGDGQNVLGKLWMELRAALSRGADGNPDD